MDNTTSIYMISLDQWNSLLVDKLIPDIVVLVVYLLIGIVENALVIHIHLNRLKTNFNNRYFIPALAVADLLACLSHTCFSFSINILPVKYENDFACKFMWFLCANTTIASALILVIIAVQRYLKICRPFDGQMTKQWRRVALGLMLVVCLLISFPCFFFFGSRDIVHRTGTVGKRCTNIRGPWTKTEALIYKTAGTLVIVGIVVSLVVFYSLIGHVIRNKVHFHKTSAISSTTTLSCNDTFNINIGDKIKTKLHIQKPVACETSKELSSNYTRKLDLEVKKSWLSITKKSKGGLRLSIIFMLITFVFILSYVPKATILMWESINENFWTDLSPSEMGMYRFLYTFSIFNNIVNPFIYGFFDRRFCNEVFEMMPELRCCQWNRV